MKSRETTIYQPRDAIDAIPETVHVKWDGVASCGITPLSSDGSEELVEQ
jgi:hypothetical protein